MIRCFKSLLSSLAVLLFAIAARGQTFTFEIDAGHLYTSGGTTAANYLQFSNSTTAPMSGTGALLQVIATTTGAFSNPTPGSFTGGNANNYVIADFSMNNAATDEFDNTFAFNLSNYPALASGDVLMLRWFPTITYNQEMSGTTPSIGTTYGQFTSSSAEFSGASAWMIPSNPGAYTFGFLTMASEGSRPESAGEASSAVTAVPEPATFAGLAGVLVVGAMVIGGGSKFRVLRMR
jgi:hypothetical protein